MSSNLVWYIKPKTKCLPDDLKYKLSINGETLFDRSNIDFLRGLAACDIDGAQELIELIDKYGEVYLKLEY